MEISHTSPLKNEIINVTEVTEFKDISVNKKHESADSMSEEVPICEDSLVSFREKVTESD